MAEPVIAMAMDRNAAGQIVVRHDSQHAIALNYPTASAGTYTQVIPPNTTVALEAWETSRDPEEDARFDQQWGRGPRPLSGDGKRANLAPGGGHA